MLDLAKPSSFCNDFFFHILYHDLVAGATTGAVTYLIKPLCDEMRKAGKSLGNLGTISLSSVRDIGTKLGNGRRRFPS